jgi:hypothetical protein
MFTVPLLVSVVLLVIGLVRARSVGRWLPTVFAIAFVVSFAPTTGALALVLGLPFVACSWLLARHVYRASTWNQVADMAPVASSAMSSAPSATR